MIKIFTTAILLTLVSIQSIAGNITNTTKATAQLVASCTVSAQSISFGTLATPLYAQSASSSMNVRCSKEAPYKIDMVFGLSSNYWQVTSAGGSWANSNWSAGTTLYDSSGNAISQSSFSYPQGANYNSFLSSAMNCTFTADGKCHARSGSSNNGVMIGIKDSVAYTILIPGDSSKVWSLGVNSYTATGTGSIQTIPVQAQIVPSQSSPYPAPDIYSTTVTANITY